MALLGSLPKWNGFGVVDEEIQEMTAMEAIEELDHVMYCLSHVWIEEHNHNKKEPSQFDARKVLTEHLRSKLEGNVRDLSKSEVELGSRVSAVVSSLAIAVLAHKDVVELKKKELKSLLSCLALEADPTEEKCTVYEEILREFNSESIRATAADAIESLCCRITKNARTVDYEWLLAVPLLHFLRGDSKPFEEPEMGGQQVNSAWWGTENLSLEKFDRFVIKNFVDVLPRLDLAFEVDRLLPRTVLCVINIWHLNEVSLIELFSVPDLCVALMVFFPPSGVSTEKLKNVEQCVQAMVNIMESEPNRLAMS
ncbi:E3 ubiquitin-protein ligase rnf213-alpha-like [Acropora millepora]|uniref:E3 ubiquitin-protein ligase rnf213-alpha-like n=1 Tax=Acropora millepora TaxID=45264 RepID=UPI001CF2C62B|nr:E3 ubiquitin-protein ligase rnf213-alpha-like [Acropora millepora]